jgi:predicted metal-binding protein
MSANFDYYAVTRSAKLLYSMEICIMKPDFIIDFTDRDTFAALCRAGCVNYNKKWSCPPHAPVYASFALGFKQILILFLHVDMEQFAYIENSYLQIKAANTILKSRADRFLRQMAAKYGRYISTGSCRLCKPCKHKIGLPCANPESMTYSFEAMGVDVGKLVAEKFQKPLLWYKPHCIPQYTSVVCGLLTNAEITAEDLHKEYLQHIIV